MDSVVGLVSVFVNSGAELDDKIFSKNWLNLFCACPKFKSSKPSIKEPAKPRRELLNAILIPSKGALKPSFNELKKPATFVSSMPNPLITFPTDPIVLRRPQKVPRRPKKTN